MLAHVKENYTITQRTYKPHKQSYIETLENISEVTKIRIYGIVLVIIGIVGCVIFPEDATGGLFVGFMGLLVALFCNEEVI